MEQSLVENPCSKDKRERCLEACPCSTERMVAFRYLKGKMEQCLEVYLWLRGRMGVVCPY